MGAVNPAEHLGLVWKIAHQYARRCDIDVEDLAHEGVIGLMIAAERFDPSLGYKFSTYANHWIRATIRLFRRDRERMIRLPHHVFERLQKANALPARPASLDQVRIKEGSGDADNTWTMLDLLEDEGPSPEDALAEQQETEVLWREVDKLTDRERDILRMRFVDGLTLAEVGERYGLTRERIRQIEVGALMTLRKRLARAL